MYKSGDSSYVYSRDEQRRQPRLSARARHRRHAMMSQEAALEKGRVCDVAPVMVWVAAGICLSECVVQGPLGGIERISGILGMI